MIGRRCPVPPARRDGCGQLRSPFTSADLPHLRQAVRDLSPLRPRALLLQRPLPGKSSSQAALQSQSPIWTESRRSRAWGSLHPPARLSPAPERSRDRSIFPYAPSWPQDASGGRRSLAQPAEDSFDRPLRLVSLHHLRPARAIRWFVSLKWRSRMRKGGM